MVRVNASHQCGPGSIPGLGITHVLVLIPCSKGFLRVLWFSCLYKNQLTIPYSNSIWETVDEEPLHGGLQNRREFLRISSEQICIPSENPLWGRGNKVCMYVHESVGEHEARVACKGRGAKKSHLSAYHR